MKIIDTRRIDDGTMSQVPGNASLRDEFAMRAMQTMLEQVYDYEEDPEVQLARFRLMAKDAYQMADVMLAVRNVGDQGAPHNGLEQKS